MSRKLLAQDEGHGNHSLMVNCYFFLKKYFLLFIYLAVLGLSFACVGFSLLVAYGLNCPITCGILVP